MSKWVQWGYDYFVGIDRVRYFVSYYLPSISSLTRPFDQTSLTEIKTVQLTTTGLADYFLLFHVETFDSKRAILFISFSRVIFLRIASPQNTLSYSRYTSFWFYQRYRAKAPISVIKLIMDKLKPKVRQRSRTINYLFRIIPIIFSSTLIFHILIGFQDTVHLSYSQTINESL